MEITRHTRKVVGDVIPDFEVNEEGGQWCGLINLVPQVNVTIAGAETADRDDSMTQHLAVFVVDAEPQVCQVGQHHLLEDERTFVPNGVDAVARNRRRFISERQVIIVVASTPICILGYSGPQCTVVFYFENKNRGGTQDATTLWPLIAYYVIVFNTFFSKNHYSSSLYKKHRTDGQMDERTQLALIIKIIFPPFTMCYYDEFLLNGHHRFLAR